MLIYTPVRLFVALFPRHDSIETWLSDLRASAAVPDLRWVPQENVHMTLLFVGETHDARRYRDALERAAANHPVPSSLVTRSVGPFPNGRKPRVLALHIEDGTGPIRSLRAGIIAECEERGLPFDRKAFRPHVTLAYVRRGSRSVDWTFCSSIVPPEDIPLSGLSLVGSELTPAGARYTPIFQL